MSTKYTDLPLTEFPDGIDSITNKTDVSGATVAVFNQFKAYLDAGDYVSAYNYKQEHTELDGIVIDAATINKMQQAIVAIERMWRDDIDEYIKTTSAGTMFEKDYDSDESVKTAGGIVDYVSDKTLAQADYDSTGTVKALGGIPDYVTSRTKDTVNDVVSLKYVAVTLTAAGWSDSAPYTQTVSVSGMTEEWVPGVPVIAVSGTVDTDTLTAQCEALGYIKLITSAVGSLTFTAPETKPEADLTLRIPGMTARG